VLNYSREPQPLCCSGGSFWSTFCTAFCEISLSPRRPRCISGEIGPRSPKPRGAANQSTPGIRVCAAWPTSKSSVPQPYNESGRNTTPQGHRLGESTTDPECCSKLRDVRPLTPEPDRALVLGVDEKNHTQDLVLQLHGRFVRALQRLAMLA
jgi:hypothetical protein